LITSPKSELIAIYGRRRIGKTFLVHLGCVTELLIHLGSYQPNNKSFRLHKITFFGFMHPTKAPFQLRKPNPVFTGLPSFSITFALPN
jgi:AAA+ ATPase superfamily predicted ATPase